MAGMSSQDKPLLVRLGVHPNVQTFFQPYLTETCEELYFKYGNSIEHASLNFHRVPLTEDVWTAGDFEISRHIFICGSAMDAISWLHLNYHAYCDNLFFVAVGSSPSKIQFESYINQHKQYHLLFGNAALGAVCDLKVASFIRNQPLKIIADDRQFIVSFRSKHYYLKQLSLHALEKAARFHFNIPTHKPKKFNTYYEQLKHGHPH